MKKLQPPSEEPIDYDSPWKEILERYFKEFLRFFFPIAYKGIAWTKGYEFLDKELQRIERKGAIGRRTVDKLVKVWTTTGKEAWVVVHVEVQGQHEKDFARRMYTYNYRLFDRYNRRIVSLAVLADERKAWRPKKFGYALWGCKVGLEFPIIKLLDYADQEANLETSLNPFAFVVLAYLKTRSTRHAPKRRFTWKLRLFKLLYQRGYSKADILELTRFIDWVMVLPKALEDQFDDVIVRYEEEQRMQYITTFERRGIEKGKEQGIQQGIQQGLLQSLREAVIDIIHTRFDRTPETLVTDIDAIENPGILKELLRQAATIGSVEEFMPRIGFQEGKNN